MMICFRIVFAFFYTVLINNLAYSFFHSKIFNFHNKLFLSNKVGNSNTDISYDENSKLDQFLDILLKQGLSNDESLRLVKNINSYGFNSINDINLFAKDFENRPEFLSKILQSDFNVNILDSHKLRSAMLQLIVLTRTNQQSKSDSGYVATNFNNINTANEIILSQTNKTLLFKHFKVAKSRKQTEDFNDNYGIKEEDLTEHLKRELNEFSSFMTITTPTNQESPIRNATAIVYYRHAKLFLGWYINHQKQHIESINQNNISIRELFPCKERDGACHAFNFMQYLRDQRKISVNYESNVIRGLTKLAKYIFHEESHSDHSRNGKSFDDIPVIAELRKLHRQANQRHAGVVSRASDEKKKWLTWNEFLSVVDKLKIDYETEVNKFTNSNSTHEKDNIIQRKRIANKLQRYLILAIFSAVPYVYNFIFFNFHIIRTKF